MHRFSLLAGLLLLLVLPSPANARCLWVSPDGQDGPERGARDRPFRTIQSAISAAQPGDTIYLLEGNYEGFLADNHDLPNVTIRRDPGARSVVINRPLPRRDRIALDEVDPSSPLSPLADLNGVVDWKLEGITFQQSNASTTERTVGVLIRGGAQNVAVRDCTFQVNDFSVVVAGGARSITVDRNVIQPSPGASTHDNAVGVVVARAWTVTITNNALRELRRGIVFGAVSRGGSIPSLLPASGEVLHNTVTNAVVPMEILIERPTSREASVTIRNNIFLNNLATRDSATYRVADWLQRDPPNDLTIDGNLVHERYREDDAKIAIIVPSENGIGSP